MKCGRVPPVAFWKAETLTGVETLVSALAVERSWRRRKTQEIDRGRRPLRASLMSTRSVILSSVCASSSDSASALAKVGLTKPRWAACALPIAISISHMALSCCRATDLSELRMITGTSFAGVFIAVNKMTNGSLARLWCLGVGASNA